EEHNRLETDRISDFLFVTEPSGVSNLERESVPGKVYFVGNVMIDNLVANLGRADSSTVLDELHLTPGSYFTGTFHRPSNVDALDNLRHLLTIMRTVCRHAPYVLPMHPRTRHSFERNGLLEELNRIEGLILVEPLGYLDFLQLMRNARGLVTDSGGIQEETTYLGIPCLTMRRNTERPVTIDVGTNTLLGDDISGLEREIDNIMHGRYKSGRRPDLWDGHAATRIVDILVRALERRPGTHAGHGARRATA
ncbi:MAG: UDP-N-acetylglucosamine 2-epimerase, partial [Gammaproteobacteria bacterium]|nr:UDP-N-acetylglucosamine 2-epimerase [Gammaproteobacteria bacterium]